MRIDQGSATDQEIRSRNEAATALRQKLKKDSDDLQQKFKNKWGLEGDEKSSLFHKKLNKKKSKGGIKGIQINDSWITEPEKVKKGFFNHFQKSFKATSSNRWTQDLSGIRKLSEHQLTALEADFTEKEIEKAIWTCGGNKSPGPDGFTIEFLKHFWDIIKPDLMDVFKDFTENPHIPQGCNSAFITLIPKTLNPTEFSHFRPISLIGLIYKIVTKVLANRLKEVLPSIISEVQ